MSEHRKSRTYTHPKNKRLLLKLHSPTRRINSAVSHFLPSFLFHLRGAVRQLLTAHLTVILVDTTEQQWSTQRLTPENTKERLIHKGILNTTTSDAVSVVLQNTRNEEGKKNSLWHLARDHCFPTGSPKYTPARSHCTHFRNPDAEALPGARC